MKFKSLSRLLPLVVGSAAAGVLASMAPAKALIFNVGGTNYDVTTVTTTYSASSAQLQATPWWGNSTLASSLAQAVQGKLGQESGSSWQSYGLSVSPIFSYNDTLQGTYGFYSMTSGLFPINLNQNTSNYATIYSYAILSAATGVPFDIPGGATIPAVGSLLALGAMRKAKKSIASKTRIANPVVAVR